MFMNYIFTHPITQALHRQRMTPIHKNLRNKQASGTYDSNKAHRAFGHAAKDADRYHKEHGHRFSKATRDKVAAKMRDEFESDSTGHHDHHLHKKHQKKKKTSESVEHVVETVELSPYEYLANRILDIREANEVEITEDVIDEDYIIERMIEEGYSDEEIVEAIKEIED